MVNYQSFKISRDYSKEKALKDDIFNTKDFNKRLKNFLEEWDHFKSVSIKYNYRDYMPIKKSFTKKINYYI